jgi:hypothetical protein
MTSTQAKTSIAWHPKNPYLLACAGEIKIESMGGSSLNGLIELINIKNLNL